MSGPTPKDRGNRTSAAKMPAAWTEEIRAGSEAAKRDLENFCRTGNIGSGVALGIEREVDGKRQPSSRADVVLALRSGQAIRVEAEPGAGKSTTLYQLAGAILTSSPDCVAVIVPLVELAFSQRELIDEVANRTSFRNLGREGLSRIAETGRLIALCDGWNELSSDHRHSVRLGLSKFRRDFPDCGVLVATRAFSSNPIEGASYLYLLPPTWKQQLDILKERLGAEGEGLLLKAQRTPGLRDFLRTPLYLSVLADISGDGVFPATKNEAIHRFINNQERRVEHGNTLRDRLQNCHREYLVAAGRLLTSQGAVAISESDLRTEIAAVTDRLVGDGQVSHLAPQPVIDVLVSHHVLIERASAENESLYSFQHHQFQEWFASFHVQDCIIAASRNESPESLKALESILDQSDWTESLLFAIERLSRASAEGARHVSQVIVRTIGIDPMLAAAMIHRASPEAWMLIAKSIAHFALEWFASDDWDRAFRFMVMTGRPEFAESVWEIIGNKEKYDQAAILVSGCFAPSVLGADGGARYLTLPSERRRSLLWDLGLYGGQEGIDFVVETCRSEASAELVQWALEILEGHATDTEFSSVWKSASQEVWARLASQHEITHTSGDFKRRLLEEKRKLAAASTDSEKLTLLLELAEAEEYEDPQEVINLALAIKQQNALNGHLALTRVSVLYPNQLSRVLIEYVVRGEALPPGTGRMVKVGSAEQQVALLAIATDFCHDERSREIASRALNQESAQSLIADLFTVLDELHAAKETEPNLSSRYQAVTEALYCLHPEVLVPSLLGARAEEPRHISGLAEMVFRWRSDDRNETLPIDQASGEHLCRVIDQWVEGLVGNPNSKRRELSNVATAIKRVALPNLLPSLTRLLDAELGVRNRELDEHKGGNRIPGDGIYTSIHRQAFEVFEGGAARDLLVKYIGNPDFEIEAATVLRRFGADGRIARPMETPAWTNYKEVSVARSRRPQRRDPPSAVAAVILDRIDALVITGDIKDFQRAIALAMAVAEMDYGDRIETIYAVATAPGTLSNRYRLLSVLLFSGEAVPEAIVRRGTEEALANILSLHGWSQNDWWVIGRWFELLAFTEAPGAMIKLAARLPAAFRHPHYFERIVFALGYAGGEPAFETLLGLAEEIQGLEATHYYPGALAQIGSLEAANHLVSLSFDPRCISSSGHASFTFANSLAAVLKRHPLAKENFLAQVMENRDAL